jgi:hypothetical protein
MRMKKKTKWEGRARRTIVSLRPAVAVDSVAGG